MATVGIDSSTIPTRLQHSRLGRWLGRRAGGPDATAPEPVATPEPAGPPPTVPLRWHTIPAAESSSHAGMISRILRREEDGMTVTGVFTPEEAARACERLDQETEGRTASPIGWVLGMPLGEVGPESQDRNAYFDDSDRARAIYREALGVDPEARIAEALDPMAGDLRCGLATEGDREYNPGHMRWFLPGNGGLRAHAGNEFGEVLKRGAMSHLAETTRIVDHLSYFVVLQKPEIGGSLSVYDLLWDPESSDDSWENGEREDAYFDGLPRLKVDPEPGDLVVFGGGFRWHRIEPVLGPIPRMTYGGFCAPSVDGTALQFWI